MFSNRWLLLVAPLTVAACQLDIHQVKMQGLQRHSNGLVMPLPDGFTATALPDGFDVVETGHLRNPLTFQVRRTCAPPPESVGRKYLGLLGPLEAIETESNAGSSGPNYKLTLWLSRGTCWIALNAAQASEHAVPDFLPARAAAELSSVTDSAQPVIPE